MKIIVLGAGQVGTSVVELLAGENNDVTVVDVDSRLLHTLQDRVDIRTVEGSGSHPEVLAQAGAQDADLILAVTSSDETNMVACQVASTLFHTPTKIARIRSADYLRHPALFAKEAFPVDVIISPEQIITDQMLRLIEYAGALQVVDFAGGKIQLVAVRAYEDGPLVGSELAQLRLKLPGVDTRVAAIYRRDRPIIPEGNTVIEADDEVFFISDARHSRAVMGELGLFDKPVRRVILAGAGNIGYRLASALETKGYVVKLIDHNLHRARKVSELLEHSVVLHGDASDTDLLRSENIEDTDVFCGLTNDDEANILSAMLAKRLGARRVMALVNRAAYVDLIQSEALDIAFSPRQATIGSLLTHIRRGDVVAVHSLRRGAAEAIEAVAHGDPGSSKVIGRMLAEISLPPGTTIGAILRDEAVIIAHHDTVIQAEDHVILFVTDKRHITDVEKLFQVDVTFF